MSVELTPNCVPRRRWGKTELSIPVIPYGTQGFGSAFRNVSLDEAFALMQRAVELGINHFDTARCYTGSFEKLGQAIKQGVLKREEIIISSRLCCHSAAPWGGYGEGRPDYSAERAIADIENQLEVLGTTYLDAVFIHDPGEIEPTLAPRRHPGRSPPPERPRCRPLHRLRHAPSRLPPAGDRRGRD
ncbi:MAG: hypothetical protein KatS3mg115_2229 [Candidatus Poribacteria bacterium]|nr:MAG: hypothetical protein KatS3mg115_2229 [Candidatus Poribacteria bacterium]